MMGCGTQHCTCLSLASADSKVPELDHTAWDGKPFVAEERQVSAQKTPAKLQPPAQSSQQNGQQETIVETENKVEVAEAVNS